MQSAWQRLFGVRARAVLETIGSFQFCVPAESGVTTGDFVVLSTRRASFLGQVGTTDLDFLHSQRMVGPVVYGIPLKLPFVVTEGFYTGSGRVIGQIHTGKVHEQIDRQECDGRASIGFADLDLVRQFYQVGLAEQDMRVGALLNVSEPTEARLRHKGLKRPTGIFGQTGSGKSFALGILLEEIHLRTDYRLVVLDPNGDYVRFADPLKPLNKVKSDSDIVGIDHDEYDWYKERHEDRKDSIALFTLQKNSADASSITVSFSDLDTDEKASLLEIDRTREPALYHELLQLEQNLSRSKPYGIADTIEQLAKTTVEDKWQLRIRLENRRLEGLDICDSPRVGSGLLDTLRSQEKKTILIDMSGLNPDEKTVVAGLVLRELWEGQRTSKKTDPDHVIEQIIVVDEAHHLFPSAPLAFGAELSLKRGAQLAAEGRKLGLYLLVVSQLPSKLHERVVSQCGNLILLQMSSQNDLEALAASLSYVPNSMFMASRGFRKGDALVCGPMVPAPTFLHFEGRKTQEAGQDL